MTWTLRPATDLQRLAPEWNALQRTTTDTPFLDTAFLVPLLAVWGQGDEKLALRHDATGALTLGTIVRPLGKGRWETFQPSQLPLGPWVCAASTPLADAATELMRVLPGLGLAVGLTQLDPRLHPRPADDETLRTLDYVSTSWVDIAGDFDAYWESRGKNLRQNTRKQRNKLEAEGLVTTLERIDTADDVAAALADYGRLESTGWKAGTGTAIHPDNEQGRFYRQMLENFCAQGHGRIYSYRFGEQVVAMDLCIDNGPVVVILKTARTSFARGGRKAGTNASSSTARRWSGTRAGRSSTGCCTTRRDTGMRGWRAWQPCGSQAMERGRLPRRRSHPR